MMTNQIKLTSFAAVLIFVFSLMKPDNSCAQVTAAIYQKCASSVVVVETDLGQHSGFFVDSDIIATDMYYLYGARWVRCYANDGYTPYEVGG